MATRVLVDTTSTQTLTNKTLTAPTITSGTVALAAAPTAALDAATKGYVDGVITTPLINGSLSATIASNNLTLHLKTAGGATPSSSDPVRVTFRHSTDSDGSLVTRTVTSSTTMTFSSGSTLGMTNGVAARIWVGLLDNSGTVEVCAWNPLKTASSNTSLYGFTPNTDVSTTAEGSGTATNAHVLYSTNARSTLPFVLLGFIEISEATAGVWASAPTVIQTYRDGMRKTGDLIQVQQNYTSSMSTGSTQVPNDNTIPQNSEGVEWMSQAIVPTTAVNVLMLEHTGAYSTSNVDRLIASFFQDSTANALYTYSQHCASALVISTLTLQFWMRAGTTSSTTIKVRTGPSGGATTITFNGENGAALFNNAMISYLRVSEICA